jgi:hypothetical protein
MPPQENLLPEMLVRDPVDDVCVFHGRHLASVGHATAIRPLRPLTQSNVNRPLPQIARA